MNTILIPALRLLAVMTLLTGILYPLAVTGIATVTMHGKAEGSIIYNGKRAIGSDLLAQKFSSPQYFHARPSAADYATVPSGASNLGPTSAALKDSVARRRAAFIRENNLPANTTVPSDMLFASGSGLDPHISPEAARLQINRIATARGYSAEQRKKLEQLVENSIEGPQFGFLGEPRVNVLNLNALSLALSQGERGLR